MLLIEAQADSSVGTRAPVRVGGSLFAAADTYFLPGTLGSATSDIDPASARVPSLEATDTPLVVLSKGVGSLDSYPDRCQ